MTSRAKQRQFQEAKHPQHPQVAANFRSSLHSGVETRHMVGRSGYVKATAAEIILGSFSKLVCTTLQGVIGQFL